jgi:peptidoglycan/xylan/chitin deacetylase (PgdA/CDA1 family)
VTSRRTFLLAAAAGVVAVACAGRSKRRPQAVAATTTTTTAAPPAPTTTSTSTTTTAAPTGPALYIAHGPAASTGVALTFHTAGDPAITQSLLDQAAGLGAKLTFFVVGTWAAANPDLVKAILAQGHELGNHTWSHIDIQALPEAEMVAEVQKCADVLQQETGSISQWFRPSQTDVPDTRMLAVAGQVGYRTCVGYDIDPLDYEDPGAALVEERVKAALHGGAIVSLHTLYEGTAEAFANIVAAIRAAGLEPVTTGGVIFS